MGVTYLPAGDVLADPADALVNTVNCKGFMGKGVALAFARDRRFKSRPRARPKWGLESDYKDRCRDRLLRPGEPYVFEVPAVADLLASGAGPRFVINFPTKDDWRASSRLDWISAGLHRLPELVDEYKILSLAMPPIGAGLGGLDWADVRRAIDAALGDLPIPVRVYEPPNVPC